MSRWVTVLVVFLAFATTARAQSIPDPSEQPLWQAAVRSRGLPASQGDRVFVLSSSHDVVAFALDNGKEIWRRSTGEPGAFTEGSRAVVSGRTVIVGDWDVYAFDVESGDARWAFHPSVGYAPGVYLGPAVDGVIYAGSPAGALYAIDVARGTERWRTSIAPAAADDILTTVYAPAVNGTTVVAGFTVFTAPNTGGVVAVDAASGKERWRFQFPHPDGPSRSMFRAGGPVLTPDLAITAAGDGRVWALDLATGAVRWSLAPLQGPIDGIITTTDQELRGLAVTTSRLLVGSLTGYLVAYDLASQKEVWRIEHGWLGSLTWENYTVEDGIAYVPFFSGFLMAVDVDTGEERWRTRDYEQGLSWPAHVTGQRVIAAGRGGVWALPAPARPSPQP